MSKKHFKAIAEAISRITNPEERAQMAKTLIPVFRESNPKFDEGRFLKACNL